MKNVFHNYKLATIFVSVYLLLYTVLHQAGASLKILGAMFLLSPFLVIWMVYTILRYAPYNGKELKEGEEWGYGDKNKDDLSVF
ncbi:MAG: hypothetical protein K0Q66_2420 [Chitinophagaceae bacterium]|jgi:hypothetical protein|nr:hypothetical protein [Chitinophagaceae bacterium]